MKNRSTQASELQTDNESSYSQNASDDTTVSHNSKNVNKKSERDDESISNRFLLANALESAAQNDLERKRLQEYKVKIETMNAEEETLDKLNAQIRELSFASGPRDTKKIRELRDEAIKVSNRLTIYDNQLLRLEASAPLRSIVERSKKKAYEKVN